MGSDSDMEIMKEAVSTLQNFQIDFDLDITSAHRSLEKTIQYAREAEGKGIEVIIAGAGGAAHLAGVIAAETTIPVIGVPLDVTPLCGLDSLLSMVQMPGGVPVATMAIGKAGAKNAAIFATMILGIKYPHIAEKIMEFKRELAKDVEERGKKVKKMIRGEPIDKDHNDRTT